MLQEFQLSITNLGNDRYLIRTEDMEDGVPVAEAQVQWPVDDWLKRSQPAMDDPILGLLQGRSPGASSNGSDLIALGKDLYEALFQDESIRESWHSAQGIAQHDGHFLRLRLGFKDSRLQRLPWEVLHHKGQPLATRTTLTFTRYSAELLASAATRRELMLPQGDDPLRVLMVVASPDDQTRLNLRQEVEDIQQVLAESSGPTRIHITVLEQPDRTALTKALEQGNHHILHYAGHSNFGDTGGDLHLVNQHTGLTEKLTGENLAGLLTQNQVYLAVFNSCRSGQVVGDDDAMDWRQQNLVQALLHRGVPSVIAMAERIPDQVAMTFTQLLYKNITRGYPIDLSLGRARQALVSAFSSDQHYWALPVLYMQPVFDGFLTERDRAAAAKLHPWDNGEDVGAVPPATGAIAGATAEDPGTLGDLAPETATDTQPTPDPNPDTDIDLDADGDDSVARLVQQLSQPIIGGDEAPDPADPAEDLLAGDRPKAGLEIYDELPTPPQSTPPPLRPTIPSLPEQERHIPVYRSPQRGDLPAPSPGRSPVKALYVWMGIGFAGLTGLLLVVIAATESGLLPAARQRNPDPEAVTPDLVVTDDINNLDAEALIANARRALEEGRYQAVEDYLDLALTLERLGKTPGSTLTDAVTTLVVDAPIDELPFIRGRLAWQQIRTLGNERNDATTIADREKARSFAQEALSHWSQLPDRSIRGRVLQGFAEYYLGDLDGAIASWEAALERDLSQAERSGSDVPTDTYTLYAYAGLAMAYYQAAQVNPAALQAPDLQDVDALEAEALEADAGDDLAEARELFLRLQALDTTQRFDPSSLELTLPLGDRPETWSNWLWTPGLVQEWQDTHDALSEATP